jgi:hypothetical protein
MLFGIGTIKPPEQRIYADKNEKKKVHIWALSPQHGDFDRWWIFKRYGLVEGE